MKIEPMNEHKLLKVNAVPGQCRIILWEVLMKNS